MPSRELQLPSHAVTLLGHIFISLLLHNLNETLIAPGVACIKKKVEDIKPMLDGDCGTNLGEAGFCQSKSPNKDSGGGCEKSIPEKTETDSRE